MKSFPSVDSHFPVAMADPSGRTIDYLRISVTDRCNERCLYCMPEGYKGWTLQPDHLTADEVVRIVEAATRLGFRKFRITGGEPLIRKDIFEILRRVWDLPGVQTLGLSTNATCLAPVAHDLKQAGVRSVNISLDALAPAISRKITGGELGSVLAGIQAASNAGFEVVKLNCVRGFLRRPSQLRRRVTSDAPTRLFSAGTIGRVRTMNSR